MSHRDSHDVIVVGAGASGLAAATALHAAGRDTVCLEARDRIGGLLLSAPVLPPDRALDLGATWFWDGEERVRALAARGGIETFEQHLAGDTILQDTTGTRRLAGNLIDAPSHRFATGAQSLACALAAALPTDVLRSNTPVTAIHPHVRGGLDLHTPAGTLHAEHVVLAVPPALALERIDFGDALPADTVCLARSTPVWMGAVAKVVAQYSVTFWREAGLAGAAISRTGPLQEIHDMSGPDGGPAALFGFAHARTVRPGFDEAVLAQLAQLFGPAAATPDVLHVQDWSTERWTAPSTVQHLADYSSSATPSISGRRSTADCTGRPPRRRPTTPDTSKAPSRQESGQRLPCWRRAPARTNPASALPPRADREPVHGQPLRSRRRRLRLRLRKLDRRQAHTADTARAPEHGAVLGVDLTLRGVDWPAVRDRIFGRIAPSQPAANTRSWWLSAAARTPLAYPAWTRSSATTPATPSCAWTGFHAV